MDKVTNMGLSSYYIPDGKVEAGCDEAGRGPLVGDLFAAAVILGTNGEKIEGLNDSKKISPRKRSLLRIEIESKSVSWAIGRVSCQEIDKFNVLNASIIAMHRAIAKLKVQPDRLLIDGNKFNPYLSIEYHCIIKGDSLYKSIAAASILAKTHRDEYMLHLHGLYPNYEWDKNMGYPTERHFSAIERYGLTPYHRHSFAKKRLKKFF